MTPEQFEFEAEVLRRALEEVASSGSICKRFEAHVMTPSGQELETDVVTDIERAIAIGRALLLRKALPERAPVGQEIGSSLLLGLREVPDGLVPEAGGFVITTIYQSLTPYDDIRVPAAGMATAHPLVVWWAKSERRFQFFNHRYDPECDLPALRDITRAMVIEHALGAIAFFDRFALSDESFLR